MSTIPAPPLPHPAAAAKTAADTMSAANAALASRRASVISCSTATRHWMSTRCYESSSTSKVAGQRSLSAQQTKTTPDFAIGALQSRAGRSLQAGVAPLSNGTALCQFTQSRLHGRTAIWQQRRGNGQFIRRGHTIASAQTCRPRVRSTTHSSPGGRLNVSVGSQVDESVDVTPCEQQR